MLEQIFLVEEAPEGGYIAKALGEAIFTQADDLPALRTAIKEAVLCHFEDDKMPKMVRLQE
ncbi:MAG: 2-oxoisovalerate dehydrogenase [Bacteroidetes bacterium]|nr:MAG: 2-oxoisovalerate dehydrogenase [Bacteroidota bacterium]